MFNSTDILLCLALNAHFFNSDVEIKNTIKRLEEQHYTTNSCFIDKIKTSNKPLYLTYKALQAFIP